MTIEAGRENRENHSIQFNTEIFRDNFSFHNSAWAVKRFPFPLDKDDYTYSVNLEPHEKGRKESIFENRSDVNEHYASEPRDRALVLAQDPLLCQSLPHMTLAGRDQLELIRVSKAEDYPDMFELRRNGNQWRWINKPLGIDDSFTFLDESTLSYGSMEYITHQAQGDFALLDQCVDNLWMDAGLVTTQADWSLDFDISMNFFEWPEPLAAENGIYVRALKSPDEYPARQSCAAAELDDDPQLAAGYQPREPSQTGRPENYIDA